MRLFGWMVLVGLLGASEARAQEQLLLDQGITSQENFYGRPGYPTIRIFVLGDVGTSGIWRVEPSIQFIELLALSDVGDLGQVLSGDSRDVTTIRVYRQAVGRRELIYEAELTALLLDDPAAYPVLQDGDVMLAETREESRLTFGRVLQVTAQSASLILLALRVADAFRGGG